MRLLQQGISLDLIAIRNDGTEIRIEGVPERLVYDEIPPPQPIGPHAGAAWTSISVTPASRPSPRWLGVPAALLLGLVASVRRRRPRTVVPR